MNKKSAISRFFTKADKVEESFYFQEYSDGKFVFYPWGRSRQAYDVSIDEKNKFMRLHSLFSTFILILIPIAALLWDVPILVFSYAIILVFVNFRLITMWVIPFIFLSVMKLKKANLEKANDKHLTYTFITVSVQIICLSYCLLSFSGIEAFILFTGAMMFAYPFLFLLALGLLRPKGTFFGF